MFVTKPQDGAISSNSKIVSLDVMRYCVYAAFVYLDAVAFGRSRPSGPIPCFLAGQISTRIVECDVGAPHRNWTRNQRKNGFFDINHHCLSPWISGFSSFNASDASLP